MSVDKVIRDPLWATLVGALVAAIVMSFFVLVQSGEAAQVADEQPYEPKIVGGTAVPNGKYPFIAALLDTRRPGTTPFDQQFCGGTLIDKNSVLTAGHCVDDDLEAPGVQLSPTAPLRVTVGRTVLNSKQGQVRRVSRIVVHPDLRPNRSGAYDVAVLKLIGSVSGIQPIKLATEKQNNLETPGRKLTVAGWGLTGFNGTYPNRLRQAQVPVVSDRRAERSYDAVLGPSGYVPPLMIAAGNSKVNGCVGDSGGPLFDSGSRTQVGIVSGGYYKCGTARYTGVYTEVNNPNIRNFIVSAAKR
jgi:secreted trypsin-like serine protease